MDINNTSLQTRVDSVFTEVDNIQFVVSDVREKNIYDALAIHQTTEKWDFRDILKELHHWVEIFDLEFKLEIQELSLSIDWLHSNVLGHFREGHNGFGLCGEVAINRRYLKREFWQVLGTLLHELLHCWQQKYGKAGKRNYHNKELIDKAKSYGLIINSKGITQYEPNSPFFKLLQQYGINVVNSTSIENFSKPKGFSKLKKWSCGCTNVRVAVADFQAQCLRCGNKFQQIS